MDVVEVDGFSDKFWVATTSLYQGHGAALASLL